MDTEDTPIPPYILALQARLETLEKEVEALNSYRIYRDVFNYDEDKAWKLANGIVKEMPE